MAETRILEHAIPRHLQTERTIPAKTPENFMPPFPAYTCRFPETAKDLVMAVIGVQHEGDVELQGPDYEKLVSFVGKGTEQSRPKYWEAAAVTDDRGFRNEVVIPYWQNKADFEQWKSDSGFDQWWASLTAEPNRGWFVEVFLPTLDRFETVFSDNVVPEGAAYMRSSMSGEMQQHVYWGSMRDRLAAAQTDHLAGERAFPKSATERAEKGDTKGKRVRVSGRQNLAIIRSGQDWSNTTPHERKLYFETMHPVLTKGMMFLRDEGEEVGCISNRFMDCMHKTSPGQITERTFGLAYFDELSNLEKWSKQHKTHLDIFGRFLQYAKELENNVSLRLFHEVMVVKPEQQFFEYIGCHDTTGMLASL
ncbi:hypothetical protein CERZMDRAFT_33241 [Cercospora zeae-maydis SCOH1-5]|uniref:Phenylacetaldoxime dehydratase n=1 Tax=Cercospora zeae-maydis SCOH1-5 TaxID=717836 RepID=A0A6A6FT49_9PEZI|nr:hypothetical protein CERZMDRAFT_33241 [Cercospora zeae-maydis SCOH1-5]